MSAIYTDQEKREAIVREIKWRKYVYPKRVVDNRMTPHDADYQIKIFEAIAEDYRAKTELPL